MKKITGFLVFAVLISALSLAGTAWADSIWSQYDGSMAYGGSWVGDSVPTSSDDASVNNAMTMTTGDSLLFNSLANYWSIGMSGGDLTETGAFSGNGTFTQSDGTHYAWGGATLNHPTDLSGPSYSISGGAFYADGPGLTLTGHITQTGGDVITNSLLLQNGSNPEYAGATYTMSGGTLWATSGFTFAQGSTLTGHGQLGSNGYFDNAGVVTASGGTLNISNISGVYSTDNTAGNGWYATSGGKLTLSSEIGGGGEDSPIFMWGDSIGAMTPDLVNSMKLSFSGVTGDYWVPPTISLLAADNAEAEATGAGSQVVGIWDISDPAFTFTSVDLAFRYDDALAASLGITEEALEIYHYTDGAWHSVTSSVDTANHIIYANGVTSFSQFGAGSGFDEGGGGEAIPEPATFLYGLIGLLGLAGRGFIKRRKK